MKANLGMQWIAALFFLANAGVNAGPVGPLTSFSPGTQAKASEVNGNFNAVKSAVDDNAARIGTLETNPSVTGNITLVPSTTPAAGNILKGAFPFIHNFGNQNTFLGVNAGNFTIDAAASGNTGVGFNALLSNTTGSANTAHGQSALRANTTGTDNTAVGQNALRANTTGALNTAIGQAALSANTTGGSNTATGVSALISNTTGNSNTATGVQALQTNTTGGANTANGAFALLGNTTGNSNTATGTSALGSNTTGGDNTASGTSALFSNTTGNSNTANGRGALAANTTGTFNTASGRDALAANTTAIDNTASGAFSLFSNTTGPENTAIGAQALRLNTSGGFNTAVGRNSLFSNTIGGSNTAGGATALAANTDGSNNTAFGANALLQNTTGDSNIAIGFQAGSSLTTGSDNIAIANTGVAGESGTTRIGSAQSRAFVAGIRGVTTANANAVAVVIDSAGQLGTLSSSQRVKDDVSDIGERSGVLMKLRPVTFYYKADRNPDGRVRQYGLVAEEVAKVAPELVASSAGGEIETVYYQFLAPMLLNEVQRQQRTIEAQEARIAALERQLGARR